MLRVSLIIALVVLGYVAAETKIIPATSQIIKKIIPREGCGANAQTGTSALCCQNKNNTCRVFGQRLNDRKSKTCFCDSNCITQGDCCEDYTPTCPPVDCHLDDWGPYGGCSTGCGWGFKQRTKRIIQDTMNGGAPCGKRSEKLVCYEYQSCRRERGSHGTSAELQETGKIIPAEHGQWRKNKLYNPYKDIRSNLFNHYSSNSVISRPAYCARYEITSARKSCESTFFAEWAPKMEIGQRVCVECQQFAMHRKLGVRCKGQGVYMKTSRWNALTVPGCHGEWKMVESHEDCNSCNPQTELSFIFL